jgi:putative transposase
VIAYIDSNRKFFGVEPICSVLQFAPRTYYAAKARPPSARALRDAVLKPEIARVHRDNFGVASALSYESSNRCLGGAWCSSGANRCVRVGVVGSRPSISVGGCG